MHLRFFRRVRLLPNLWVNLNRSGASISVGVRGLRLTLGRKSTRWTAGLPGSGLSVTHVKPRQAPPQVARGTKGRELLDEVLRQRRPGD
jgi:hypothetical protein